MTKKNRQTVFGCLFINIWNATERTGQNFSGKLRHYEKLAVLFKIYSQRESTLDYKLFLPKHDLGYCYQILIGWYKP